MTLRTVYDAPLQTVRLEVCDDGVGIAPDDRRQIFEPYFSTKQQGTGLGLAIVSRIVADPRGYIRVQDHAPHGTRFEINLEALYVTGITDDLVEIAIACDSPKKAKKLLEEF